MTARDERLERVAPVRRAAGRRFVRLLVGAAACTVTAFAHAQPVPLNEVYEAPTAPLAMPETIAPVSPDDALVAYDPGAPGTRHHWLDPDSIVVDAPYVRATIVVESSSGARTISHVGFDCEEKRLALLATGDPAGGWRRLESIDWQPVTLKRRYTPYLTAVYRAVCDGGGPTSSRRTMLERLADPLRDTFY
jgi:hypothetical protein